MLPLIYVYDSKSCEVVGLVRLFCGRWVCTACEAIQDYCAARNERSNYGVVWCPGRVDPLIGQFNSKGHVTT